MKDALKGLAMFIVTIAALYFGFVENYFIARLFIYIIMTIMSFGSALFGIAAIAVLISTRYELEIVQAKRFIQPVLFRRHLIWLTNLIMFSCAFYITNHPILVGWYVSSALIGWFSTFLIRRKVRQEMGRVII